MNDPKRATKDPGCDALELVGVQSGYGPLQILWGVDLTVQPGECHVLLGANGAGKSTLLRVIVGLLPLWAGNIRLNQQLISDMRTDERALSGIGFMSEDAVFSDLSVEDNLRLGAYRLRRSSVAANLERAYSEFPEIKKFRRKISGGLSGGQRKLVGLAKVLMGDPRVVIMDEPSSGLSPVAVKEVIQRLHRMRRSDVSLLIAEQNVAFLELADRVSVIEGGRDTFSGTAKEMRSRENLRTAFFGVKGNSADNDSADPGASHSYPTDTPRT